MDTDIYSVQTQSDSDPSESNNITIYALCIYSFPPLSIACTLWRFISIYILAYLSMYMNMACVTAWLDLFPSSCCFDFWDTFSFLCIAILLPSYVCAGMGVFFLLLI